MIDAGSISPAARLAEWARRSPDAIALRSPRGAWTYAALQRSATAIAARLGGSGRTGDRIGLLATSEEIAMAAVFAAIRARRVAVPLDAALPAARLARILEVAGAVIVAAEDDLLPLASSIANGAGVAAVEALEVTSPVSDGTFASPDDSHPDDLGMLLFTSGSTGTPKGIGRTLGQFAAAAAEHGEEFGLTPDDRLLLTGPISFSANVSQVVSAIWAGASLRSYSIERDGLAGLAAWMRDERVTVSHWIPTLFRRFAGILAPGETFPDVRLVRMSGEMIRSSDVELWRRHFPASRLSIGFAMTEAGRICGRMIAHDEEVEDGAIAAGWPRPGTRVELLDIDGRPAAPGEAGEIVVVGRSVLREYWKDPALSAERIASAPGDDRARVYRTGDLGRWTQAGLLHLGRKDLEVKIRGVRVHLAEVETALASIPGVDDSAAAGRPDGAGGVRLVAYFAGDAARLPPRAEVRRRLRASLPETAVPAAFVLLPELPRTPTGKVDRAALPDPTPDDYADVGAGAPPRDALEERLIEIWRRTLPARVDGVTESFFDLGGDSLTAVQMLAAIEQRFGRRLGLPILLDHPTIESLARVLREPSAAACASSTLVPLQVSGTRLPFFCVPGGNGPGFNFRTLSRLLGENQPFYAFHVMTETGERIPETIEGWADQFLPELKSVQPRGPYRLGGHSFGGTVAYEIARRLLAENETVEFLALFDTFAPGYPRAVSRAEKRAQVWRDFLRRPIAEKLRTARRTAARVARRAAGTMASRPRDAAPNPPRGEFVGGGLGRILRAYTYGSLPIPLILFRGAEREQWRGLSFDDPDNGWRAIAGNRLRTHRVAGGHDTLIEGEGAAEIARWLSLYLSGGGETLTGRATESPRADTAAAPSPAAS